MTALVRVSMAELHPYIVGHILKRLDVWDLIRCKSVCKSWESLICDPLFVKIHLNHSYNIDCNNNDGDRRIAIARFRSPLRTARQYESDNRFFDFRVYHLLGSSNGLVCISPFRSQFVVANPSTREVKALKNPQIPDTWSLCWGFGYDSSTDDYKVMLGFLKGNGFTCFQMLTLKSNIWKVIGDVNYSFTSRIGILCNGALHWVMKDASLQHNKKVILSFSLSKEEFKEIPQPDDARYDIDICCNPTMRLGIMEGCLCAFSYGSYGMLTDNIWTMKNYNVKKSWRMVGKDCEIKFAIHSLKGLKHYIPHKMSFCHEMWYCRTRELIGAPIYVQSLVSPHVNGRPKRKRQTCYSKKSYKLIKGDLVPGPSAKV